MLLIHLFIDAFIYAFCVFLLPLMHLLVQFVVVVVVVVIPLVWWMFACIMSVPFSMKPFFCFFLVFIQECQQLFQRNSIQTVRYIKFSASFYYYYYFCSLLSFFFPLSSMLYSNKEIKHKMQNHLLLSYIFLRWYFSDM